MSFSAKEIVDARFVKELEDGGMHGKSLQKINRLIRVPQGTHYEILILNDAASPAIRKSSITLDPDISLIRCTDALASLAKLPNCLLRRARAAIVAQDRLATYLFEFRSQINRVGRVAGQMHQQSIELATWRVCRDDSLAKTGRDVINSTVGSGLALSYHGLKLSTEWTNFATAFFTKTSSKLTQSFKQWSLLSPECR
jgi:hypothetical protein